MKQDYLLEKVREAGFESIDDFVKANLHYLPKDKQQLFHSVVGFGKDCYRKRDSKKSYYQKYQGDCYNGED